ncbi:MAG: RNA polymerase sigma factor [Oscillospiraceae bacterium]
MRSDKKLEELYRLYEKPMYHIALAILKNHYQAEDAVSDAFGRLITKLDRIGVPDSIQTKTYIIKVIKSTAISIYRKNANRVDSLDECEEFAADSGSDAPFAEFENKDLADKILSDMDEEDAKIVILRGREGLPYREIADIMSMNEATVRKHFERAKKSVNLRFGKER